MRQSIGRAGSAILELLIPSAQAQACTAVFCQQNGSRFRCCKFCPTLTCTPYATGSCKNRTCPQ
jgi:hypothetical protein